MCGIAGIISPYGVCPEKNKLVEMSNLIAHRGPDGTDHFIWNNVALAHRRLAIVETTDLGHQPMNYNDLTIIYNGEVYNFKELREELTNLGHKFKGHSDTEVILHAWEQWGENCLNKFNGMWAFALLSKSANTVWMARDRFGVKPLYYATQSGQIYFSSEISPILKVTSNNSPNISICKDFLHSGFVDHTKDTFFEGIKNLPGGHLLKINLSDVSISLTPFYKLTPRHHGSIEDLLFDSVKLRLRADVPVGTCLSGGLDSSIISTFASKQLKSVSATQFNAIHASTTETEMNETKFAEIVANDNGIKLSVIEPKPDEYIQVLNKVIRIQQEPFNSSSVIMQYFVMEKAKAMNLKVMLDGQGADELFLGYKSYPGRIAAMLIKQGNSLSGLKIGLHYRKSFIKNMTKPQPNYIHFQIQEILSTHLPALLRYEDRNSMASSIEARLPFMDYRIVETALSLSVDEKIHGNWQKFVLRKIADKHLSKQIAWRKDKIGFVSPSKSIMKKITDDATRTINKSSILKSLHHETKNHDWRSYCLAKWEESFFNI